MINQATFVPLEQRASRGASHDPEAEYQKLAARLRRPHRLTRSQEVRYWGLVAFILGALVAAGMIGRVPW